MRIKLFVLCSVVLAMMGCDSHSLGSGRNIESLTGPAIQRYHDPQQVALGESLYRQHCVECHGQGAVGSPDWRHRDTDGLFPPPPLDGTGHAWHHPTRWLKQMILDGSPAGQGKMPAWRGKISEPEAEAIITWFQSLWPDQIYAAWYETQQNSK